MLANQSEQFQNVRVGREKNCNRFFGISRSIRIDQYTLDAISNADGIEFCKNPSSDAFELDYFRWELRRDRSPAHWKSRMCGFAKRLTNRTWIIFCAINCCLANSSSILANVIPFSFVIEYVLKRQSIVELLHQQFDWCCSSLVVSPSHQSFAQSRLKSTTNNAKCIHFRNVNPIFPVFFWCCNEKTNQNTKFNIESNRFIECKIYGCAR